NDQIDGGLFLFELVPAMKARILEDTGVAVPGIRMRASENLAPSGYAIQVNEVTVGVGAIPLDPQEESDRADGASTPLVADAPRSLIAQLESVIRAHLDRPLGVEEVARLVEDWRLEEGDDLITSVLPSDESRLRLTWLLQDILADGFTIRDR